MTAPEIALPELDGKTAKMYRGGKICLSDHFKPLWGRDGNSPIQSILLNHKLDKRHSDAEP